MGPIMIFIGICAIVAGILIIIKRAPFSRRYIKLNKKLYGKTGGLAVQGGMASPGFVGLTGVGFTLIGAAQILIGIFSGN